ncbi:MAG TPA: hypothetical protein VMB25_22240 [Bryobacteraceae bacterium]|nr:hypothetical protein [Bryobacteraceae bacterium]
MYSSSTWSQVAQGLCASDAYHDFIGFQVAKPELERAFEDTYSLPLGSIFGDLDLALGTYRYSVSRAIPEMTKTAWVTKKKEIVGLQSGIDQAQVRVQTFARDLPERMEPQVSAARTGRAVPRLFGGTPGKVNAELRANIVRFYRGTDGPPPGKARDVLITLRTF